MVQPLRPGDASDYERYLLSDPTTLIYASLPYRNLIAEHLGATPYYFIARGPGGEPTGILPAMLSTPGEFGPVLNSLPFYGSNGGAIVHSGDIEVKRALIQAFHKCAETHSAAAATIITSPLGLDAAIYEADGRFTLRNERIGQITPLPEPGVGVEEQLLALFDDPRPRNIRRAIKAGVTIEHSDTIESLDFLFRTHLDNMMAMGGRTKPWAFFEAVPRHIGSRGFRVYVARMNGEPIAALLLLYFNKTVEYFTPVTVESWRREQPLSLLIFRAMLDAIEDGYRSWNWGGTWLTQDGVHDFKRRWGTVERRYHYFTRILNTDVLNQASADLLKAYPNFFVAPFSSLGNAPSHPST